MPPKTNRLRLSIASLMLSVAAFALVWAVILPLVRQGPPPCLSTAATARWLALKPTMASCNDCHPSAKFADRLRALLPLATASAPAPTKRPQAGTGPSCVASVGLDPKSCIACHGK
jgi:hypothetical protein